MDPKELNKGMVHPWPLSNRRKEMNNYEAKKLNRIERIEQRIIRLRKFAEGKDLSLFGEAKSGIPLGQPILVGHHSERRHRKHLERINNIVRKGYDAAAKADRLESRLEAIRRSDAIQSDNPEAKNLLKEKLERLEQFQAKNVLLNKLVRQSKGNVELLAELLEKEVKPQKQTAKELAEKLLTKDFAGRIGIPDYVLSNNSAEIRRLKKRLEQQEKIESGFEPFTINEIFVELVDGQIQVTFPRKPSEATRDKIKGHGIALKWSNYSKKWVRKHTATTGTKWFKHLLTEALTSATYE